MTFYIPCHFTSRVFIILGTLDIFFACGNGNLFHLDDHNF